MNDPSTRGPADVDREPRPRGAVVFDCDGLLLDTEDCWADAEEALFVEHGRGYGPEEKRLLLGAGPDEAGRVLAAAFGLPGQETALFARLLELATSRVVARARPMPGAEELLRGLSGTLPLGVASNSPRALLEAALGAAGLLRHFDAVVGSDQVEEAKPAPDPYLLACRRLRAEPVLSVALEDSPTGVAAARAAGMFVVGVPSMAGVHLGADLVAGSLSEESVYRFIHNNVRRPARAHRGSHGHEQS